MDKIGEPKREEKKCDENNKNRNGKMSENIESPNANDCLFYIQIHLFASSVCFWVRVFSSFVAVQLKLQKFIFEDKVQIQSIEIKMVVPTENNRYSSVTQTNQKYISCFHRVAQIRNTLGLRRPVFFLSILLLIFFNVKRAISAQNK